MANPYYNPQGSGHADYGNLPQSPFQQHQQQQHPTSSAAAAQQQHPMAAVYQHSPYAVHQLSPHGAHSAYGAAGDHSVMHYTAPMHPSHGGRWVDTMDTDDGSMLPKFREEDPEEYELDHQHPPPQDHQTPQPQQQPQSAQHTPQLQKQLSQQHSMHSMQGHTPHESQTHAAIQPMTSQPSDLPQSPANRPTVIRTGKRGRPPGSKNKVPSRRKSSPSEKLEETEEDVIEDTAPGIKTKYGRKVHAPQQFQPSTGSTRKRRPMEETYFCHICSRSGSPSHNKMIFCDSCDTPYHQHCHVPPVEDSIFTTNNKWFCSTCKPPIVETVNQRMIGQGLTVSQKRASLRSMSRQQLEELVIEISQMDPSLPLFPTGGDVVDQFEVPRAQGTPRQQQRLPDMDINEHPQYNHHQPLPPPPRQQRLSDPDMNPPHALQSMTPMHDSGATQQSPIEASPMFGQTDLPHYELMIVNALTAINDPNGSPPKAIWDWMNNNYPCNPKFRASASQALQKALKKGRLFKTGSLYKINPEFNPATADNPKATRKPQVGRMHPLFNQLHSRNNSIGTIASSPMQPSPQHTQQLPPPSQGPSGQLLPPPDLPSLSMNMGSVPTLPPRDPHGQTYHLDHASVYGGPLGDPTGNPFDDSIQRTPPSHDVMSSYPHHGHQM